MLNFFFYFLPFFLYLGLMFIVIICFQMKFWKLFTLYFSGVFFYLFLYFFMHEVNILYWIIKIISQNGQKLIVLGDSQEFLYFLVEFSFFFTYICITPLVLYIFYFFYATFWTYLQDKSYSFLLGFLIYSYMIALWIFYQDVGFSSWEVFYLKEEKGESVNLFWKILDYQPQMENIYYIIKTEAIDIFCWQVCLFLSFFLFFKILLKKRSLEMHFITLIFFILTSYFFWGGDGGFFDLVVLSFTWLFCEFWIFSFYFFFNIKKVKVLSEKF